MFRCLSHRSCGDEIEHVAEDGGDRAELWAYEIGTQAVRNRLHVAAPRTADWVAEGF
jgi:hypothetical protein